MTTRLKLFAFMLLNTVSFTSMAAPWVTPLNTAKAPALLQSPEAIASVVDQLQEKVESLPADSEANDQIAIAVSLSMPKASLLRLAQDAKDAGLALSFRGVGETIAPSVSKDGKMPSVIERYGSQLLKRHLGSFDFLRETGVTIRIDPVLFEKADIDLVPQVLIIDQNANSLKTCTLSKVSDGNYSNKSTQTTVLARAVGDVTLAYALRHLEDEFENRLKTESENTALKSALKTVHKALEPLGERP